MAQDNEEIIAEARRKALRNGEEDPVVVAQRYLNIYRQMHIFSPERKEAFNKMLLELPANIAAIFAALPGGLMLQDYLSDLAEKNGQSRPKVVDDKKDEVDDIPEVAPQAAVQTAAPVSPQPQVQFVPSGNVDLSLGKDFAQQLAGAFDNVLTKQGEIQRDSLEKISASLSKNQVALAHYINQNNESQQQNFSELLNVLAQKNPVSAPVVTETTDSSEKIDNNVLQELINNQKDISLRLNKMESTALSVGSNNNQELINALVKSNTEMMEKFKNTSSVAASSSVNTEDLLKLIEQTQAQLIEGVVGRILQSNVLNNSQSTASNNNANNIQINTPDTSAQTIMLVNKITDLQASNEKNMEEAISRLITAQKEIYENISAAQSKEIAQAIVSGLQSASLTFNNYAPPASYPSPAYPQEEPQLNTSSAPEYYPSDQDNDEEPITEDLKQLPNEDVSSNSTDNIVKDSTKKKKKKKKKKDQPSPIVPEKEEWHIAKEDMSLSEDEEFFNPEEEFKNPTLPEEPINTTDSWDNDDSEDEITEIDKSFSFQDDSIKAALHDEEDSQLSEENVSQEDLSDKGEDFDVAKETTIVKPSPDYDNILKNDISSWGFDNEENENYIPETEKELNDNSDVVEDEAQYEEVEMIGNGSNIYSDDLSNTEIGEMPMPIICNKRQVKLPVIPQIFDDADEDKDPYVK